MSLLKLKEAILKKRKGVQKESAPLEIRQINAGLSRLQLKDYLMYSDFDNGYMFMINGDELSLGFGFILNSYYTSVNNKKAFDIEKVFGNLPVGSVVQSCEHACDNIKPNLDLWSSWQDKYNTDATVKKMNKYRYEQLLDASHNPIHKPSALKLRKIDRYVFVTIPFHGALSNTDRLQAFLKKTSITRDQTIGVLTQAGLSPHLMDRSLTLRLLRKLINPNVSSEKLDASNVLNDNNTNLGFGESISDHLTERSLSCEVRDDGGINFNTGTGDDLIATHLTVDKYPPATELTKFGFLTGNMMDRDYRINKPYFLYTMIHIVDPNEAKEQIEVSTSWLGKQAREGSATLKDLIPHIYDRYSHSRDFLKDISNGHKPVRMFTGLIVYSEPSQVDMDVTNLITSWTGHGYSISQERHISFPMWLGSLPWQYRPENDQPRKGFARLKMAKAINAASCFSVVGDWVGNVPLVEEDINGNNFLYSNGIPLVTGRGELAYLDLFKSETNYNFTVLATSGAGKSFFANDLVRDIRSRGGLVYVFDMGGSYSDICKLMKGTNLDFPIANPISINHFWGIDSREEYLEMKELFEQSLKSMAFNTVRPSNEQDAALNRGLYEAWEHYGSKLGLSEIYDFFMAYDPTVIPELRTIAPLLYNYAKGTDSIWFNGEPQVDLDNPFTILELRELENVPTLKSIVFTTIMMLVTKKIYSADRSIPKILLIDEAWSLLDDDRAGPFIEKAFRTIRKFFGAAGIISQSAADIHISSASKAAFNNSAWRIFLMQKADSIAFAKEHQLLGHNTEAICDVLGTLKRRDNFSELLVEHDGMYSPYRFFVDKFSAFCYSSKAQDNTRVDRLVEDHGIPREVALEVAAGYLKVEDAKGTL